MIWEVLVLGFVLSLDNFRVSIALGTVPFGLKRAVQVALTFGLWDGIMPLIGLLIGNQIGEAVGDVAEYVGAAALGGYGLYRHLGPSQSRAGRAGPPMGPVRHPVDAEPGQPVRRGEPGLLGLSPWFSAAVFGLMTAVLSLVGLQVGRAAARLIRIRSDLLSGVTLIIAAVALPLVFGG